MLDTDMMRTLLSNSVFEGCRERLSPALFSEDIRDVYEVLADAHREYGHDLTTREVMALWLSKNPVATAAQKNDMRELLEDIDAATALSGDVVSDVVQQLWKRDLGKKIATMGLSIAEGDDNSMSALTSLIEKHANGFVTDDFGTPTTLDIMDLLSDLDDSNKFKFNIPTLSQHVYGIGPEEFGVVFATPNTGKTAFLVSLAFGPGGFLSQGCKVMILGNEEATRKTVVRAYQSLLGLTKEQIIADPKAARERFWEAADGRVVVADTQDWDLDLIEAYIGKERPDVVIIDQLDKVHISGRFDAGHERLRELYRRARETAKRYKCAVIGVSQASDAARGRTRLTFDMLEGSKIGKAAEADLIIGIGKVDAPDADDDPTRYLTVSKNKLSGWHGTIIANLNAPLSRYEA
jgi:replicative DNA helicase